MKPRNIQTQTAAVLPQGKADFLLAASVTKTCEIEGITQAGIPRQIPLTPTLDAEFLSTAKVFSLPQLAETPKGVPTPGLLTRAVHQLFPFSQIKILDLGLTVLPQNCSTEQFAITPSESIATGAQIDSQKVFQKGLQFGQEYTPVGDYVILGESTPSGTTTAQAVGMAIGLKTDGLYSSSFKNVPNTIKEDTLKKAAGFLSENLWQSLDKVSDNMLLFCAGFIINASLRFPVVLAGGTQMATCFKLSQKIQELQQHSWNPHNIKLCTTSWVALDSHSSIQTLLKNTPIESMYSSCSFESATIPVLHLYDQGEAKEGVGAGAAVAYAQSNGISMEAIVAEVERLMSQA